MASITLFVPCYVDWLAPAAAIAATRALERLGHRVDYRPHVVCCGQPLTNSGCAARGDRVARRWFERMAGEETVIVLSSSCTAQLWHAAARLGLPQARRPAVYEFCQFLARFHPETRFGRLQRTVCLHSACHGLREGDIDRQARAVLARIDGLRIVQAQRADECCGFGGTFSVSFPDLSVRMGEDRITEILRTGAVEVTATDLSCLLHLRGIAEAQRAPLAFRHIAELVDEAARGSRRTPAAGVPALAQSGPIKKRGRHATLADQSDGSIETADTVRPSAGRQGRASSAGRQGRASTAFNARAAAHLADEQRHRLLDTAAWRARMKREHAARDYHDQWEPLRERAAAIKAHALDHLDAYLERFVERAGAAGASVHFAETGADVNAAVLDICRRHGARSIVKSKSMTTEECGLNAWLERHGIEVIDTDLGERIVQLAGEAPSHIVAPALHRSTRDIAELFARTLGTPADERDPARLTGYARRDLRRHFLEADLAITGANFAVADSGTIVVVENEGNSLLSTSLPRVHIAVLGIEKVIPGFSELSVFLRLLARSATGQPITVYTTHYTGPQPRAGGEAGHEPRELHVVLVDAGRTALLADPEHRLALACIRCGACLNVCPVYRRAGGYAYGWTYPGPIGSVLAPAMEPPGAGPTPPEELPFASSLCGACTEICPVKIDLHHQLLSWRRRLVEAGRKPMPRIARLTPVLERPALFRLATRLGRRFWPLARFVAGPWLAATDGRVRRTIPSPAPTTFREWWSRR